jgi:hypothetical protein
LAFNVRFVHSASFAPILALLIVMMLLYVARLFSAQFLYFGLFGDDPPTSASELCDPVSYDPTGRRTDTGKRRHSGRRFDQSSNFQSCGDGGLGIDCCGAAGCGDNRVF